VQHTVDASENNKLFYINTVLCLSVGKYMYAHLLVSFEDPFTTAASGLHFVSLRWGRQTDVLTTALPAAHRSVCKIAHPTSWRHVDPNTVPHSWHGLIIYG